MTKYTTWVTPCPECDFKTYTESGFQNGPEFHEEGDTCPRCRVPIRIKFINPSSPLGYAEATQDLRK